MFGEWTVNNKDDITTEKVGCIYAPFPVNPLCVGKQSDYSTEMADPAIKTETWSGREVIVVVALSVYYQKTKNVSITYNLQL